MMLMEVLIIIITPTLEQKDEYKEDDSLSLYCLDLLNVNDQGLTGYTHSSPFKPNPIVASATGRLVDMVHTFVDQLKFNQSK